MPVIVLAITAMLSFSYYLVKVATFNSEKGWGIGVANTVTLVRGIVMLMVLMGFITFPTWVNGSLLIFALILDGIDGYIARRRQESSLIGQYLDVEMDALFVVFLCVLLWKHTHFPVAILFIGSLRYLYLMALIIFVRHEKLEPRRRYASVIAVFLILALIARLLFSAPIFDYLLVVACILVILSFARSMNYQLRNVVAEV